MSVSNIEYALMSGVADRETRAKVRNNRDGLFFSIFTAVQF